MKHLSPTRTMTMPLAGGTHKMMHPGDVIALEDTSDHFRAMWKAKDERLMKLFEVVDAAKLAKKQEASKAAVETKKAEKAEKPADAGVEEPKAAEPAPAEPVAEGVTADK